MDNKKVIFTLTTIFGALYGGFFILACFLFGFGVLNNQPLWSILLLLSIGSFAGLFMRFLVRYLNGRTIDDSLQLENLYSLGQRSVFFNLYAFQMKVTAKRNSIGYRRKNQSLIAFTNAVHATSSLNKKGNEQNDLNSRTAMVLNQIFSANRGKYSSKNNIFCFDRGIFLIYNFGLNSK